MTMIIIVIAAIDAIMLKNEKRSHGVFHIATNSNINIFLILNYCVLCCLYD
jgi:hypothetical protein